jgi:hypothetical protein
LFDAQCSSRDTEPLNPEALARQCVPMGGQTLTRGVEISVYGAQEVRNLEGVSRGVPLP